LGIYGLVVRIKSISFICFSIPLILPNLGLYENLPYLALIVLPCVLEANISSTIFQFQQLFSQ
ncbi:hypothetical protein, partial [Candidatus Ichthyocystis sparus]|uniref:hypothetical protein n=1 Tax=Candidatus Ichthyocystis sparus TaxID=1561004 RepID=UPI001F5E8773